MTAHREIPARIICASRLRNRCPDKFPCSSPIGPWSNLLWAVFGIGAWMSPSEWWLLVLHLGIAGSMGTVGSLNIQWWWQDRTERILLYTGVLCWSLTIALIFGAIGVAYPNPDVWHIIVPVRAVLLGIVAAIFLKTLSTLVALPLNRVVVPASLGIPMVFALIGSNSAGVYVFPGQSQWPVYQPLGNVLIGISLIIFIGY